LFELAEQGILESELLTYDDWKIGKKHYEHLLTSTSYAQTAENVIVNIIGNESLTLFRQVYFQKKMPDLNKIAKDNRLTADHLFLKVDLVRLAVLVMFEDQVDLYLVPPHLDHLALQIAYPKEWQCLTNCISPLKWYEEACGATSEDEYCPQQKQKKACRPHQRLTKEEIAAIKQAVWSGKKERRRKTNPKEGIVVGFRRSREGVLKKEQQFAEFLHKNKCKGGLIAGNIVALYVQYNDGRQSTHFALNFVHSGWIVRLKNGIYKFGERGIEYLLCNGIITESEAVTLGEASLENKAKVAKPEKKEPAVCGNNPQSQENTASLRDIINVFVQDLTQLAAAHEVKIAEAISDTEKWRPLLGETKTEAIISTIKESVKSNTRLKSDRIENDIDVLKNAGEILRRRGITVLNVDYIVDEAE